MNSNDKFEVFSTPISHNTLNFEVFLFCFLLYKKKVVHMFSIYPFSILIVCLLSIFHMHYTLTKLWGQLSKHYSSKPDIMRRAISSDTNY